MDRWYRWIDKRNRIPFWAKWFWPYVHWCPEMDDLLITDNHDDCFCGHVPYEEKSRCARLGIDSIAELFDMVEANSDGE